MTIYDISLTISPDLPTWPGDPRIELDQIESMDKGADVPVTWCNCRMGWRRSHPKCWRG
jgi:kynurenine formamidase